MNINKIALQIIAILTVVTSVVYQSHAQNYRHYKFPPLEEAVPAQNAQYPISQNRSQAKPQNRSQNQRQAEKSFYYQQPRYVFPEIEEIKPLPPRNLDRAASVPYSAAKKQNYIDKYRYNSKKPIYSQYNAYNANAYPSNMRNPWNNYSNSYNNSSLPFGVANPFSNNGFFPSGFGMNSWSPFTNSLSDWSNNGGNQGTRQGMPNIRTPGFFSQ